MANSRGGKRAGAGRPASHTAVLRVTVDQATFDTLARLARYRRNVPPEKLTAEIGRALNRLMARVKVPADVVPEYLRLVGR